MVLNVPVPDVVGLKESEAKILIEKNGFILKSREITKTPKRGRPEGGLRVVRQRCSGQEFHLVLAYEKWVCD